MRRRVRLWIVVTGLVVLHFLLHVGLGVGRQAPDLLTVALLLLSRDVRAGAAAGAGLFFGLLEDAMTVLSFGANAVAMTLVGGLGALTRDLFVGDSLVFFVSYFMIGKWIRDLAHWLMMGDVIRPSFVDAVLVAAPLASLYASGAAVVVIAVSGLWGESPGR